MYAYIKYYIFIALFFGSLPLNTSDTENRIAVYNDMSTYLALLSNEEIETALTQSINVKKNSSLGNTGYLFIKNRWIFFKKIHLTFLEKKPENIFSTKNLFELPLYYQYGVGSTGFSSWRELNCHLLTTHWVLTNTCPHFPLLYHWRIIPRRLSPLTAEESAKIKEYIINWNCSSFIEKRIQALYQAPESIVLFLEYIPYALNNWIKKLYLKRKNNIKKALTMIENDLITTTSFMHANGIIHIDAHFHNILTDGFRLYFTDFGLSIMNTFDLSDEEKLFFNEHKNYDYYVIQLNIFKSLIKLNCRIKSPVISAIQKRYAPIANRMHTFFEQLYQDKTTPLPILELEALTTEIRL